MTLSPDILSLVKIRAAEDRDATGADTFIRYESFKAWAWLNTESQDEFDAALRKYREIADFPLDIPAPDRHYPPH